MARKKQKSVKQTIDELLAFLKSLQYRPGAITAYRHIFNRLLGFAESKKILYEPVTLIMINRFLKSQGIPVLYADTNDRHTLQIHGHLKRLLQFQDMGMISMHRHRQTTTPLSVSHQEIQDRYIRWRCEKRDLRPSTVRGMKHTTYHFLQFLRYHKIRSFSRVRSDHIVEYFKDRVSLAPKTVAGQASHIRDFLQFLVDHGYVKQKLLGAIPRISYPRWSRLPDVWPKEAVEKLLACIDQGSPCGKRDYAICMLIAHLGLRVGDIRHLRFEQIDWRRAIITISQSKTSKPVELPFTEDIGQALIEYLKHGRPQSPCREIFLTHNAPFRPFKYTNNLVSIISTYRRKAGIVLPEECHGGFHSLRHSIATRLHEAEVPLNVIAAFLGHSSVEATRHYAKVNIKMLRRAALEWEEVDDEE